MKWAVEKPSPVVRAQTAMKEPVAVTAMWTYLWWRMLGTRPRDGGAAGADW